MLDTVDCHARPTGSLAMTCSCVIASEAKQSNVFERLTRLIATRLTPLAMTDRDVSLTLNMTMNIFLHALFFVIASVSVAINRQRIPRKSARKAMAKPQHSAALDSAIFDSPLLMILFSQPQRTAAMFEP